MYYSLVPDPTGTFSDARSQAVGAERHARHAGPRVSASDQRRPPAVRQQRRRVRGCVAQRRAEPHRRGAAVLSRRRPHAAAEHRRRAIIGSTPAQVERVQQLSRRQLRALRDLPRQAERRRRCTPTTIRSRRAARPGICCATSPTIRGPSTPDTWSAARQHRRSLASRISRTCSAANYLTQIRDWATSVFADDRPGHDRRALLAAELELSRSIFPRLVDNNGNPLNSYPLPCFRCPTRHR